MCCFTVAIATYLFLVSVSSGNCLETNSGRIKLSGFGTLGVVTSNNDELGFYRDVSQYSGVFEGDFSVNTDSLLGLQLDTEITSKLNTTFQVVFKDRPDDDADESIEQLFLHYRIQPNISFRLGRLPIDVYMLADYRYVGFAYLWARPPVELYGRIPFTSYDGVDFTYSTRHGDGTIHVKLFGGTSNPKIPLTDGALWDFNFRPTGGVNISYQTNRWNVRGGVAFTKSDAGIPSGDQLRQILATIPLAVWPEAEIIARDLDLEGDSIYYYSVGFSYDNNDWLIQSELAYIDSNLSILPDEFDGYASVGHSFGAFTPYIMVAMAKPDDSVRYVSDPLPVDPITSAASGGGIPDFKLK